MKVMQVLIGRHRELMRWLRREPINQSDRALAAYVARLFVAELLANPFLLSWFLYLLTFLLSWFLYLLFSFALHLMHQFHEGT